MKNLSGLKICHVHHTAAHADRRGSHRQRN